MSAQEERDALALPLTLYDHALHLLCESPEGVPLRRGYRLPEQRSTPGKDPLSRSEAVDAIRKAFSPIPDDPATLQRRFLQLGVQDRHQHLIRSTLAGLSLSTEQVEAARAVGRQLPRTGTTASTVTAGALLARLGELEDVPYLSALGLFRQFTRPVVHALDSLDRRSAAVV